MADSYSVKVAGKAYFTGSVANAVPRAIDLALKGYRPIMIDNLRTCGTNGVARFDRDPDNRSLVTLAWEPYDQDPTPPWVGTARQMLDAIQRPTGAARG